jgi:NAD(P)-dependent dehydrogenase (short-subunit alcohol dehydrogenase family)
MSGSSETEFTGKRALVTGGTRGIGEAIAQRLSGSGTAVVTTARSTPDDLLQPDLFVEADLSTAEGAEKVISLVRDRLGGVDILVNNVGGSSAPGGGFAALTDEPAARVEQQLVWRRSSRPWAASVDVGAGKRRDHPHLIDPAAPPAV